jgi:hypothetical protein
LEDQEASGETDQKSGATISSRADVRLVSEEISALSGALGAHCGLF